MAFDRAADFHAAACKILDTDDPHVTPGERGVILALTAQNEILMGIAEIIAARQPDGEEEDLIRSEFAGAEDSFAPASILLLLRLERGG